MVKNLGVRTLSLSASQALARLISFFWIIYLSRFLGPAEFGKYITVMSFVAILLPFCDFGIGIAVMRDIAQHHEQAPEWVGSQFWLRFFAGLICLVLVTAAGYLPDYPNEMRLLFFLGGLHLLLNTIGLQAEGVYIALEKPFYFAFTSLFFAAGWAFWGWLALQGGGHLTWLFAAMVWNTLLTLLLQWGLLLTRLVKPDVRFRPAQWRHQIQEGAPVGLTSCLTTASERLDRILLSLFCPNTTVGHFGAATLFTGPLLEIFWHPLMLVLFPVLSRGRAHGEVDIAWVTRKTLLWGWIAAWPITLIGSQTARSLIPWLFGERFTASAALFAIVLWSLPFLFWNRYLFNLFLIYGMQKRFLNLTAMALGFNVLANLLMIPRGGATGAALVSVATQILITTLGLRILAPQVKPMVDKRAIARLFVIAVASLLPFALRPVIGLAGTTALSIVLFTSLVYTWVLDQEDRRLVHRWLGRRS